MKQLALAIAITAQAFKDKLDRGGNPYIFHCLFVMDNTRGDEHVKCAAVMHDLVEDTDDNSPINYTFELLKEMGFSDRTIAILKLVTHNQTEHSYQDYIALIATSPDATEIKLADLRHNSDITRLKGIRDKDFDRIKKYHASYLYLHNVQQYHHLLHN